MEIQRYYSSLGITSENIAAYNSQVEIEVVKVMQRPELYV